MLDRNEPLPLPPSGDQDKLAQEFNDFFWDKIDNIMLQLQQTWDCSTDNRCIEDRFLTQHCIHKFHEVRDKEVLELLTKSLGMSCDLGPFPSKLLVQHCQEIVNASLTEGEYTSEFKEALLYSLLEKAGIDLIFKNHSPISNLSFLSKLIKRAGCNQITQYVGTNRIAVASHSTETALIKVKDDILRATDNQRVMCLILPNLSVDYDTVSHPLLLNRLQHHFGIQGTILKWIENYMLDHSQRVLLKDSNNRAVTSDHITLEQGVPQGSVLGPMLFTLYIRPLGDICREYVVIFQSYVDDQQNYSSFSPAQPGGKEKCLETLEGCISDIHLWMRSNLLKLNDDKTELIVLGIRQQLGKVSDVTIILGNDTIPAVSSAWNLGVHFDRELKWVVHINCLTSNLDHTLWKVAHIWHLLNEEATKMVIQALVLSKIYYWNSIYQGAPTYAIEKLHWIQNMRCRIIKGLWKHDHITSHLMDLHWLKTNEHITYKVCVLMYMCIRGMAPEYLSELVIEDHWPSLRSSTFNKFPTIRCNTALAHNSMKCSKLNLKLSYLMYFMTFIGKS